MSKFRVGDKVKLVKKNDCTDGFEINQIYKVVEVDRDGYHKISIINGSTKGYVNEEHIESVFTKSNLQNGDIVTYRDGQTRTVMSNKLINKDGTATNYLTMYKDDLKYKNSQMDIVKVERPVKYETVFERKEEILDEVEKRYLASVVRPFKKKVETITKKSRNDGKEYILIVIEDDANIGFPNFESNTMYKEMKPNKSYTLEELGL